MVTKVNVTSHCFTLVSNMEENDKEHIWELLNSAEERFECHHGTVISEAFRQDFSGRLGIKIHFLTVVSFHILHSCFSLRFAYLVILYNALRRGDVK